MNVVKKELLINLANKRRDDNFISKGRHQFRYKQPESLHQDFWNRNASRFEHLVSPWSVGACNLESDLMIVGQDWLSEDKLNSVSKEILIKGRDGNLATNIHLDKYLDNLGLKFSDVYATNLFPFVKPGNMSSSIPIADYDYVFETYLKPQIEIISPKVIVALGASVFKQFLRATGDKKHYNFSKMVEMGDRTFLNARVFPVYHPGALGTINAGGSQNAKKLWKEVMLKLRKT